MPFAHLNLDQGNTIQSASEVSHLRPLSGPNEEQCVSYWCRRATADWRQHFANPSVPGRDTAANIQWPPSMPGQLQKVKKVQESKFHPQLYFGRRRDLFSSSVHSLGIFLPTAWDKVRQRARKTFQQCVVCPSERDNIPCSQKGQLKSHTDSGETSVLLMAKHTRDDLETTQQFRLCFLVLGSKKRDISS